MLSVRLRVPSPVDMTAAKYRVRFDGGPNGKARLGKARTVRAKPISGSHWNAGFRPDCGPSRGDPFRLAIRPNATSTVAIRNVRFPSTPAGRNAQIAAIAEGRAEWVKPPLSGSSQWPSSDRKGRKSCRCARRSSIQTAALNAMIRHWLDPESLGIVGRSMANRLA
jgi:hypothetical protein